MTVQEQRALEAFQHLGLTSYEAQVFIGLHRLGTGTARAVAEVTDVPRSQVYSVADSLQARGLVEVQQANPRRFRPVSIDQAEQLLRDSFESHQEDALAYVEAVSDESEGHEEQEAVWTIRGSDRITSRVIDLFEEASRRVLFGVGDPSFITPDIEQTIADRCDAGVHVHIISSNEAIRDRFESFEHVTVGQPHRKRANDDRASRAVFIDDNALLVAVQNPGGEETAVWSAGSLLASVFIELIDAEDVPDAARLEGR